MDGQPLPSDFDIRAYEVISEPIPQGETPRQYVLRVTGKDLPELTIDGRDFTWQEVKDAGAMPHLEKFTQLTSRPPRLLLKKKI